MLSKAKHLSPSQIDPYQKTPNETRTQITDKLETTREHEKAAFPRVQAEAVAEIHKQHAGLNLEAVRAIIASDFEAKMDKNFASLQTEIRTVMQGQTRHFVGFVFAIAATSVTVATLLFAVVRK